MWSWTRWMRFGVPDEGRPFLGALYSKVGVLLGAYSVAVYAVTQGGIGTSIQPGLDAQAKVTSAYNAIWVIGFGILIVAFSGAIFTQLRRERYELPMPLPWLSEVKAKGGSIAWLLMIAGVFWCVLLPSLVLFHINKKVQNEGFLWKQGLPASSVMEPNCIYWFLPLGTCWGGDNVRKYAEQLKEGTVWLTNHRCDALWATSRGPPTQAERLAVSSDCQEGRTNSDLDRSAMCRSDSSKCRATQWLQWHGVPLITIPDVAALAALLYFLIAWYRGPQLLSDED